jgi:glucosamine-6-phosphate deaminase
VFGNSDALARAAAVDAAEALRATIRARGTANVMFASGNSQLQFLQGLAYMEEHVARPLGIGNFHYLDGMADPVEEPARYADLLRQFPIDVCCLGIGENGHLAFNDPPVAKFDDSLDVKVVTLDAACRRQQVGEGHFASVEGVPARAITVTIPALLRADRVLAIVPDARKRESVRDALAGPISTACPASILRRAPYATLYLDRESSSLLDMRE